MQVSSVELEPISHALNWESELVELNGLDLLHYRQHSRYEVDCFE